MIGGVPVAAFFGVRVDEPFGVGGFFLGGLQWWPPAETRCGFTPRQC